jgi:hypothetical protein
MAAVSALAVGLAALRDANPLWACALMLATAAALGTALFGALHGRGLTRAWWLGFLVFAGGYSVLAFGPWFSEHIGPGLATTQVLGYAYTRVTSSPVPRPAHPLALSAKFQSLLDRRDALDSKWRQAARMARSLSKPSVVSIRRQAAVVDSEIAAALGYSPPTRTGPGGWAVAPPNRWRALLPGAANYDEFLRVGHCLSALLAGAVGAVISAYLHAEREHRPACEADPSGRSTRVADQPH